jgi:mono/diheme cytochrome c family protein
MEQSDRLSSPTGGAVAARRLAGGRAARVLGFVAVAASLAGLGGCRLEMYDQPRQKELSGSPFFADSSSARPMIPGTVPHGQVWISHPGAAFAEASGGMAGENGMQATLDSNGAQAQSQGVVTGTVNPYRVTKALLLRGEERFNIYCSPCHGRLADGEGMIVQRGFPAPPSFHIDRLRQAPDSHFFDVITNGFGRMYSYAYRVAPEDRWAIIAYIRALQLSQHATPQDLSSADRNK